MNEGINHVTALFIFLGFILSVTGSLLNQGSIVHHAFFTTLSHLLSVVHFMVTGMMLSSCLQSFQRFREGVP